MTRAEDPADDALVGLARGARRQAFGKYRGIVEEVGTGDHLGLIRASVPDLYGEEVSPWAEPIAAFAGEGYGALALPVRGDGVWIECAAGDRARPLWCGGWWAQASHVPEPAAAKVRVFRSPAGHRIVVDDDANELRFVHASGAEIVLADDTITLSAGGATLELANGKVTVNDGALEVE